MHRTYTQLIQYQIMLINSSDVFQNVFFQTLFFRNHHKVFYAISVFDLIWLFLPKIHYSISKISSWLVDFVFEIYFDFEFAVGEEILKNIEKCPTSLETLSFWKFLFDSLSFFFPVKKFLLISPISLYNCNLLLFLLFLSPFIVCHTIFILLCNFHVTTLNCPVGWGCRRPH